MLDLSKKRELKIEFINIKGEKFEYKGTVTTKLLDIRKAFLIDAELKNIDQMTSQGAIQLTLDIRPKLFEAFFGESLTMFETMAKDNETIIYDYALKQILDYMDELEENIFKEDEKEKDKKGK